MSNSNWIDVLLPRRGSSDLLWVSFHDWHAQEYQFSNSRTPQEMREDVFKEDYIRVLLREDSKVSARINAILDEMSHSWSLRTVRFVGFFLTKVMKSIYQHVLVDDHIHIDPSSIYSSITSTNTSISHVLNSLSLSSPILYMPTHRSYADFLLFSYICFHFNLPLPSIAAGIDFLALNQVASLLRSCGAFFIRRSFKHNTSDNLYWHVFRAYVQTQIRGGEKPMEFFLEGTRSRNGKSLPPKTGLLSVAMELFLTAQIPDLIIIPVSISYDRILEESLYAKELFPLHGANGGKKPPETTKHLFSGVKAILAQDHGSVYVRFGSPISVREMSQQFSQQDLRLAHTLESKCSRDNGKANMSQVSFMTHLSKIIIQEHQHNLVISPFSLIALSLVYQIYLFKSQTSNETKKQEKAKLEISLSQTLEHVKSLSSLLDSSNLSFVVNNESIEDAFHRDLTVHSNLITISSDSRTLMCDINNELVVIQLQHYANQSMQLLIHIASYLYVNANFHLYQRLKNILCKEFIYSERSLDETLFGCLNQMMMNSNMSQIVRDILIYQVDYYLTSYARVTHWLLSRQEDPDCQLASQLFKADVKNLVKDIHKHEMICTDLIHNALSLLLSSTNVSSNPQLNVTQFESELNDMLVINKDKSNTNMNMSHKMKANL